MNLKQQAVSGVKWSGVSMGVVTGLQFVTLAVLARLLSPSDFGLMGMIMVLIGFAQLFADMGISNAIIYRQDATKQELSSLYWLNIMAGIVIFFVVCAASPLITAFYHEPWLSNLIYLSSLIFMITPFGQQFQILLQKELKFDQLAKIEIIGSFANSTTAITLAILGMGVFSLIWGQLAGTSLRVLLLSWWGWGNWRPRLHFATQDLKRYITFGLYQMGEKAVNYLSANIDYIIIGSFLGPAALGFYTLAYQIAIFPLSKINSIITRVAFPVFSTVQNDNSRMRSAYCKVINYISTLSFPMLIGMIVVAPEFIRLVYGPKWEQSIIVLQLLCLVGTFKSLGNPMGSVVLAKGRADIGFYWNVFAVIMISIAVIVGANWGIVGVASAILILQVPLFFIIQPIVNKLINLKFREYFKAIQTPVACSVVMLAGIGTLRMVMGDISELSLFAIIIISGMVIYTFFYYIKDTSLFTELKSLLKGN